MKISQLCALYKWVCVHFAHGTIRPLVHFAPGHFAFHNTFLFQIQYIVNWRCAESSIDLRLKYLAFKFVYRTALRLRAPAALSLNLIFKPTPKENPESLKKSWVPYKNNVWHSKTYLFFQTNFLVFFVLLKLDLKL